MGQGSSRAPGRRAAELSAILNGYADSLGGAGLYAEGSVFGIEQPKERQYTTFVTNPSVVDLGPHKAIAATDPSATEESTEEARPDE